MARNFYGPLSEADLKWLQGRYSKEYVQRMILVYGIDGDNVDAADAQREAEEVARKAQEAADAADAQREAEEVARKAQEAADAADEAARAAAEAESENGSQNGSEESEEEDLIGDISYDILGATEAEVKTWVETASAEDKAAALATEQAREDRDARKGVVALLS